MMKSGIIYNTGEIVLIPIPFTDLSSSKKRPCIVISGNDYNRLTEDLIVMAITSKLSNKKYTVGIGNNDMLNGALPAISQIRVDKIYTISQNIVKRRLGLVNIEVIDKTISVFNEIISN